MRCSDGSFIPPVPGVARPRRLTTIAGLVASLLLMVSVAVRMPAPEVLVALNATPTSTLSPGAILAGRFGLLVIVQWPYLPRVAVNWMFLSVPSRSGIGSLRVTIWSTWSKESAALLKIFLNMNFLRHKVLGFTEYCKKPTI